MNIGTRHTLTFPALALTVLAVARSDAVPTAP